MRNRDHASSWRSLIPGNTWEERVLRAVLFVDAPFLAGSVLLVLGLMSSFFFVAEFTVENRSGETVSITPIGTIGAEGRKSTLPLKLSGLVPIPTPKTGGFPLADGESITFFYDMDDLNFSEIAVADANGRLSEIVTDPDPTSNQYHGPLRHDYRIDNLAGLDDARPAIREVVKAMDGQWRFAAVLVLLVFGPWIVLGVVVRRMKDLGLPVFRREGSCDLRDFRTRLG